MKKFFKYLGIFIAIITLAVIGIAMWLFSESGNEFLKNKITQIANEKAPIGVEFTYFKLDSNSYAFGITDKQKSQIAISGKYSLLTLNTQAQVNAVIKNLSPYEKLIGMKLNGGASLNGNIIKDSGDLGIKADITAFESAIHADITLQDFNPKRLFISSKEGINIASLLYFLNQPNYANGKILFNADLDISNLTAPKGGFKIASNAILPNTTLLAKNYSIILPKDPIKLAINGEAKGENILATILANSSYLNLNSNNLALNLKDYSSNGDLKLTLQNIIASGFSLKKPINANQNLKSTQIANQEANLALNIVTNPILAKLSIPNYKPKNLTLNAKNLNLKEILEFASLPYDAKGTLDLDAKVNEINLTNLSYKLTANLNSDIQSIVFNKLNLANNNTLNADIKGDSKTLEILANSDLFDSKLKANTLLKDYTLETISLDLQNLNLQKLAKLFQYNANGFLSAKIDLKNFKDSNFDGNFNLQSQNITIAKNTLNALSGMNFKKDISLSLDGDGKFSNGAGQAELKANGKDINLEITNAKINLKDNTYSTDFFINTQNIANINPTAMELQGALTLKGKATLKNNIPTLYLQNQDFGDLTIDLANEKLKLIGDNLDVKKIANFTGNGKIIKGGIINTNADLTFKGMDAPTIIKNLNGAFLLSGHDIEIYSIDIDALAKNFEKSNQISLLDIGAFVLAGPIGIATTKGSNIGMLGLNTLLDTKTAIKQLEMQLDIQKGIAYAKDVAFATGKTRIAAIGAINLNNNAFENFSIGILDSQNCAKYSQAIKGTLTDPKIQVTSTTISTAVNLATSLFDRFKKGAQTITNTQEKCKPFYNGVVKQP